MARPKEGWKLRPPRRAGESYTVRFTDPQGRAREISTGSKDPVEAAREAERIYAAELVAAPVEHRGRIDPSLRLDELIALWLTDIETTHDVETVKTYTGYGRGFLRFFGNNLVDVTRARMGDYQRSRLASVTRKSVRKERSAMNTFLGWCEEQGVLAEESVPVWPKLPRRSQGVRAGKQRSAPIDVTAEQVRAFVLALPIMSLRPRKGRRFPVRSRFVFMAETGLRPGTISALSMPEHWRPGQDHVNVTADIDKGRRGRPVPLTPRAQAALEAAVVATGIVAGLIFGKHDYRTVFDVARVTVGLPEGLAPYDLRHHFVGFMADKAEARAVMSLAGHARLTTTNHYVRGREDLARDALSALGSGGILGECEVPMLSAKEGSRTPTRVTPLEPENSGNSQIPDSYESSDSREGSKTTPEGLSFGGPPETLRRAQRFLDVLRSEWSAMDDFVAAELIGGDE